MLVLAAKSGAGEKSAALLGNFGARDAAVLDVIFGKFEPQGKLPFELPSSMDAVRKQREDVPRDSANPIVQIHADSWLRC
jgi:beta-glucosidase